MDSFLVDSFVAGLAASIACGMGALPLAFTWLHVERRVGLGYGLAGGLMFAASVYNLILPGLTIDNGTVGPVFQVIAGIFAGAGFLWAVNRGLTPERVSRMRWFGSRQEILIFVAMCFHSIPEGVAVGVGYASAERIPEMESLGATIAIAIAIHNIPEGLAVAIPLRANGASLARCFFTAFLTSLPQPLAAVPAAALVWFFEPLMIPFLGFAAGAMIFLVLLELIPDALQRRTPLEIAWSFITGFSLMILAQVIL
jgi:zinc transporter, ZIP family